MNSAFYTNLRKAVYFLLFLLATLIVLGAFFLSRLNLDDYRNKLETELSDTLQQPVSIGHSRLTFRKGIALHFQDLRIGTDENRLIDIPSITATLQLAPLLERKLFLDKLEINGAKLQFWLPLPVKPKEGALHELGTEFGIRLLRIRNTSLKIFKQDKTGSTELISLDRLNMELKGWQPDQKAGLKLSGLLQQPGQPARIDLNLELPSSTDPEIWRQENLTCWLNVENLASRFATPGPEQQSGRIDLTAALNGVPATGAEIVAAATDRTGNRLLFSLTGHLKSEAGRNSIRDLSGELLGLPLSGEVYWLRQKKEQFIGGRFGAENIPLNAKTLQAWKIPDAENLLSGNLQRLAFVIEKSWPADQPLSGLPKLSAEFEVADLKWATPDLNHIEGLSTRLLLEGDTLTLHDSKVTAMGQTAKISGQITHLAETPQLKLKLDLRLILEDLATQFTLPDGWRMTGAINNSLQLTGPLLSPSFNLQADAGQADISFGSLLRKQPSQNAKLIMTGVIDQDLLLDNLTLQLPGTEITGNGLFSNDAQSNHFFLDIEPFSLSALQPLSPLLTGINLSGTLHPTLTRKEQKLVLDLALTDGGAHLGNIVADLNKANGRILLTQQGLSFDRLQAALGKSSFIVNGQLADWHAPRLELQLHSNKVRAQDLIFRNQQLQLYDLKGQLAIDGKSVRLTDIETRLEQATVAVVNGSINTTGNHLVSLDITAEKANIDQVIALFSGPPVRPRGAAGKNEPHVRISAKAKQGNIGNLKFTDAEGLIVDQNGVFTLYPLRFSSGRGSCLARVEFDHRHGASLLKVSGHAEDIDATLLHQDLFKERGLINGSLRGDFYLEGSLHNGDFWQNALGGIHLQVKDGTLRKFKSLSRIFSILNVSQIFTGKLPDFDKEGMPFSLLEGSMRIANGRAETNNTRIISESMNMSIVGSQNLIDGNLDYQLGVMPLRTVDKVITSIPLAGWLLAGKNEALLAAYFNIKGPSDSPEVSVIPLDTLSDTVLGVFKRTLGLPGKVLKDIGSFLKPKPLKKEEAKD